MQCTPLDIAARQCVVRDHHFGDGRGQSDHFLNFVIIDANRQVQALLALSRTDRAHVDKSVEDAVSAGGTADPTPKQDYGAMMYGRSVDSPDGHIFELMWMAPQVAEQGATAMAEV